MTWRALSVRPYTGVALLEGKAGVNWTLFAQVIAGWLMTLIIAACGAAMFTVWTDGSCSPRHGMPFNSGNEGSQSV